MHACFVELPCNLKQAWTATLLFNLSAKRLFTVAAADSFELYEISFLVLSDSF